MPSFTTLRNKFFGNTIGVAAGFAAGGATQRALDPVLQDVTNEAWSKHATVPPDAYALAQGVAQGQVDPERAREWAKQTGIGDSQFAALVDIANVGPALGYAYEAWRRGFLTDAEFNTALLRQGIEPAWFDALRQLRTRLLDLPTLANLIQRGLVKSPVPLPYDPTPAPGNIPSYPVLDIDAAAVTEGLGYTLDDLRAEVGLAGNPPGPEALYRARFRGAITDDDVLRGLVEGRARGEWAAAFEVDARQIATVHDHVENAIRGYSDLDAAIEGGQRHGMTPEDVTLIYQNAGRPLTPHQIAQALARGAKFNPEPGELPDPFEAAAHESSVKPSYQEMYVSLRYNYPPLFQLNNLVKGGAVTPDTAADWATKQGLAPEVVETMKAFWLTQVPKDSTGTPAKPVKLTQAQIRAAWREGQFTDAEALARLEARGVSPSDAQVLLDTWKQAKSNTSTSGGGS